MAVEFLPGNGVGGGEKRTTFTELPLPTGEPAQGGDETWGCHLPERAAVGSWRPARVNAIVCNRGRPPGSVECWVFILSNPNAACDEMHKSCATDRASGGERPRGIQVARKGKRAATHSGGRSLIKRIFSLVGISRSLSSLRISSHPVLRSLLSSEICCHSDPLPSFRIAQQNCPWEQVALCCWMHVGRCFPSHLLFSPEGFHL